MDEAIEQLGSFDWVLFTSANAVAMFAQRWKAATRSRPEELPSTRMGVPRKGNGRPLPRIAAIGPATARAVEALGLKVDLLPPEYVAESLSTALLPYAPGARMLYPRAEEARDYLEETLAAAGAEVKSVEAYRNRIPPESRPALQHLFSTAALYPDAIPFTSASTVRNLVSLLSAAGLSLPSRVVLASIGPITSEELRRCGLQPTVEAAVATVAALVEAIVRSFAQR